jgi:putative phage-type endonuclease
MKHHKLITNTKSIIHADIIQRSEEWHQIRLGKIGGTDAEALLVKGKSNSGLGSGAMTILYKKLYETITGLAADEEKFLSYAMQRGMDLEPYAIKEYEAIKMVEVKAIGYVSFAEFFGYSPDGFVDDDGLIEVKCPQGPEYMRMISGGEIQSGYMAQMQWGMLLTGRDWCDFVVYNPELKQKPILIQRVNRDDNKIDALQDGMRNYLDEMEARLEFIKSNI